MCNSSRTKSEITTLFFAKLNKGLCTGVQFIYGLVVGNTLALNDPVRDEEVNRE